MALSETKRLLKYIDKSGEEGLSMDAMLGFMSAGLELDQSKRIKYTQKSDMHMKIMEFLEGIWACSFHDEGREKETISWNTKYLLI